MKVTIEFTKPQPIKALKRQARNAKESTTTNARKISQSFKAAAQGFRSSWKTSETA
jgi:hypothetical protein